MTTSAELASAVIGSFGVEQSSVTASSVETWPGRPGLYAVYGSAAVWQALGLGDPEVSPL
jgi:hypothetical protein